MALRETLKAHWFWYSMTCVLCWGGWAFLSKLGSREILFTIGTIPVCILLLFVRRFRLEKSPKGIAYGILNGVLSGVGGLALFAAYHTNGNTSMITVATSLYPVITVVLAIVVLRERLKPIQALGLVFAAIAMVIFSF